MNEHYKKGRKKKDLARFVKKSEPFVFQKERGRDENRTSCRKEYNHEVCGFEWQKVWKADRHSKDGHKKKGQLSLALSMRMRTDDFA